MTTQPSTYLSRRLVVLGTKAQQLFEVRVLGEPGAFRVDPPFMAEPGVYRATLDLETHTATIREEGAF